MQNSLDLPFHQGCCYLDLVKAWPSSNIVTPHPSVVQASRGDSLIAAKAPIMFLETSRDFNQAICH